MRFYFNASFAVELVMAGLLQAAVFYVGPEQSDTDIDFDGVGHKRKRSLNPLLARYFFENCNIQPKIDIYSDTI
jgi:hypothetical protein